MGEELSKCCAIPAVGTVGGGLYAWNPLQVDVEEVISENFSISIILKDINSDVVWMMIGVYGPASTSSRKEFLELKNLKGRWMGWA